jgi:hypothetical protein
MSTLTENQKITEVIHKGYALQFHDEGSGTLWLFRESCGNSMSPTALIRCDTWENAYEMCTDEFHAGAPSIETIYADCGVATMEEAIETATFRECYGFRPNGSHRMDEFKHGIYARDYNERLDNVTIEQLNEMGIELQLGVWE